MLATWIEAAAKGRHGGQVRAGMWSAVVVGTHPIEADQEVWLELSADDVALGTLPAFWIENKGVNSLWHVPVPPQGVNVRLHYRAGARCRGDHAFSPFQDTIVRPNLPDKADTHEPAPPGPEGLVGNRMMTVRVDGRGSTHDIYFPTVGLHSDVRPAEGELPQSRSHFRAIVAGLAIGRRLDWFGERLAWGTFQHYQGATNLLMTELGSRQGPIRVVATDFVAAGDCLPRTAGGTESPGQYIKRFRVINDGTEPIRAVFGIYVQAEVNGGIGEPGLSWNDAGRTLLAINRGHGHVNRKLARDATVEFALALDDRGEVQCEPTGPNEAILLRKLEIPGGGGSVSVDLLVSGAFTGWRGDPGTFEHWLSPALRWFRAADLDVVEQCSAQVWDGFIDPLPNLHFPKPAYAVSLRRSSLAASLHADEQWGAIASGFDRGLSAYCWPREALWVGGALQRAGHPEIGRKVFQWLANVKGQTKSYAYWFQKYTIDGQPEWETPAIDQSAMIPWGLERYYRWTADREFVNACWPMVERAAGVCLGNSGHPGLRWVEELALVSSSGIWDSRFGAFLYSNAVVVAGLRSAARLASMLDHDEHAARWQERADRIWEVGILGESAPGDGPGLVDYATGRFLEARRLSSLRGWWAEGVEQTVERSTALDVSMLGLVVPFGLIPASDPRIRATAEAIYRQNAIAGDANFFARWSAEPTRSGANRPGSPGETHAHDLSALATLWVARYLIQLGRETGESRVWNLALSILDALIARLGPLGLALRAAPRGDQARAGNGGATGVWGLQSMLIETMLDLGGLDYDAPDRSLKLSPVLPGAWPHVGMTQDFACGEITYRLERPIGGSVHRLGLQANLKYPVTLEVAITCPGLVALGHWQSQPPLPPPRHHHSTGRVEWSSELPEGESSWAWTWG